MIHDGFFANKKILVTGGTGFVGSHVVEALIQAGAQVVVSYRSIDHGGYFMSSGLDTRTVLVHGDVTDGSRVFDLVTRYEISYIFHLAAQPIVTTALVNPRETLETNILGTVNVLEAARLAGHVEGVIIASSDKAYGKSTDAYTETDPLRGNHPYEVSKSSADLIAQTYATSYSMPIGITRFGNIYGEGDKNFSRVLPGIFMSLIRNEPFLIRSNGRYERAYLYVKDVALGYLALAKHLDTQRGQAFNFGTEQVLSVLGVIEMVGRVLSTPIPYRILDTAVNEIPSQKLSWEKARKYLGWKPHYTLEMVVPQLFSWYQRVCVRANRTDYSGQHIPINSSKKMVEENIHNSTIFARNN